MNDSTNNNTKAVTAGDGLVIMLQFTEDEMQLLHKCRAVVGAVTVAEMVKGLVLVGARVIKSPEFWRPDGPEGTA